MGCQTPDEDEEMTDAPVHDAPEDEDRDRTPTNREETTGNLVAPETSPPLNAATPLDEIAPEVNASPGIIADMLIQPDFEFPDDPGDMTNLPTHRDENPHLQMSQSTAVGRVPTHKPPVDAMQFTLAQFPKVIIPYKDLVANMDDNIVKAIEEQRGHYLAIIPFGAGSKYNREHGANIKKNLTDFILSLGFRNDSFDVAQVIPKTKSGRSQDFDKPWIWILECESKRLWAFLLWFQTFAVRPDLTFSIVSFSKKLKSWVITNITGGAVRRDDSRKEAAMGVIKKTLWHDEAFRRIVNDCMAENRIQGSIDERVYMATTSFELLYIENKDASGAEVPMWLLTGKPITDDEEKHREYLRIVRNTKFFVGIHALLLEKKFVNCVWCKSDTHPGHACPFPLVEDWNGPKPATVERPKEISKTQKKPAGRNAGRPNRGGRGNGQGYRRGGGSGNVHPPRY